ncbi:hypothetical protein LPB140_06420 [Sphingorhabdus lutea]|uniref:O-antigen ligase-related domain-containing protein n=1 Tax=Sphingorhabdus lutea TaxID=1913578 RepID=A0A1L3JBH3_9SPHN|nr:O-antigen ligase family protein [Sphingorhabdus lutea]APG62481.1 hypothetical protein LPB140_06420 [Sphingorhabdus lutea]
MPQDKKLHILSKKYWWVLLPALSPLFAIIFTFNLDGKYSHIQSIFRFWWMAALLAELCVIMIAMARGMTIWGALKKLQAWRGLALAIWFTVIAIGIYRAPFDQIGAIFGAIIWSIHALFAASAYHLIFNHPSDKPVEVDQSISPLERLALLFGHIVALCAICIFAFIYLTEGKGGIEWSTDLPGQVNIRHFGYYFLPAAALCSAYLLNGNSRFRLYHAIFFIAALTFLFWSGSRGPIFALAGILLLYIVIFFKKLAYQNIGFLLGAIAISAAGSMVILTPPHPSFGFFQRPLTSQVDNEWGYSSGRTALWKDTIPYIEKRPLLGYGAHQFRAIVPEARGMSRHPHNVILQALFEWGILGTIALFSLIIPMGWAILRRLFDDPIIYGPAAITISSMAAFSMIDGVFYYPLAIMLFFMISWLPNKSE